MKWNIPYETPMAPSKPSSFFRCTAINDLAFTGPFSVIYNAIVISQVILPKGCYCVVYIPALIRSKPFLSVVYAQLEPVSLHAVLTT